MESNILVTVLCISYNHSSNISKAIESFLNQRTTFDYEIIVHDDASIDGTKDILLEYEKKNLSNFKIIIEGENQYSQGRFVESLNKIVREEARGKYIAICEGDDFWIDCNKLQIQVEYMENHPLCALTAHNGLWIDNITGDISPADGFVCEKDLSIDELIRHKRGCFPTASMVMKKEFYEVTPPFPVGDGGAWVWQLYCADKGSVHYFDRIMCVYNVNFPGSWTLRTMQDRIAKVDLGLRKIEFLYELNNYWERKHEKEIQNAIEAYTLLAVSSLKESGNDNEEIKRNLTETFNGNYSRAKKIVLAQLMQQEDEDRVLEDFIKKHTCIYVMGCGKLARKLATKLVESDKKVDGFVVSNDQKAPISFMNLPVYRLSDIRDRVGVGIVIGIQKSIKSEVIASLKDNNIENYYWPSI